MARTGEGSFGAIALDAALPKLLLAWYDENARPLPWRESREPYPVWISEIMLQQTRAQVVRDYYLRFLAALPDIYALAECEDEQLLKLWQGLGYYSRARNLKKAARLIVDEHAGRFPQTQKALLRLPGVGAYTAGAIASICFEQPTPAVDGNVLRIVSRIAGLFEPMDKPAMKARVRDCLCALYPEKRSGDFTQALMELGATVCIPNGAPKCDLCPLGALCYAHAHEATSLLPVKPEKKVRRIEQRTVFLLDCAGDTAIRKRAPKGLLAGLWELPNISGRLDANEALHLANAWGVAPRAILMSSERTHVFTHVAWEMTCYSIACGIKAPAFTWADRAALEQTYALPSAFGIFL